MRIACALDPARGLRSDKRPRAARLDVLMKCGRESKPQTGHFFLEAEPPSADSRRALAELREAALLCAAQKFIAAGHLGYDDGMKAWYEFREVITNYILCVLSSVSTTAHLTALLATANFHSSPFA